MLYRLRNASVAALALVAPLFAPGFSNVASAATAIDLSSAYNSSFTPNYSGYYNLPGAGSTVTIGGVGFQLGGTGPASFVATTYGPPTVVQFSFAPITVTNTIYTLMNDFGGNDYLTQNLLGYPNNTGMIEFLFANGSTYSYTLRSGIDIRNYQGTNAGSPDFGTGNSVAFGSALYGPANNYHFDAQRFDLPTLFQNQVLTGIRLTDINPDYNGHDIGGAPFLLALDVTSTDVPEPATWLMVFGAGVAGLALRRRSSV